MKFECREEIRNVIVFGHSRKWSKVKLRRSLSRSNAKVTSEDHTLQISKFTVIHTYCWYSFDCKLHDTLALEGFYFFLLLLVFFHCFDFAKIYQSFWTWAIARPLSIKRSHPTWHIMFALQKLIKYITCRMKRQPCKSLFASRVQMLFHKAVRLFQPSSLQKHKELLFNQD